MPPSPELNIECPVRWLTAKILLYWNFAKRILGHQQPSDASKAPV